MRKLDGRLIGYSSCKIDIYILNILGKLEKEMDKDRCRFCPTLLANGKVECTNCGTDICRKCVFFTEDNKDDPLCYRCQDLLKYCQFCAHSLANGKVTCFECERPNLCRNCVTWTEDGKNWICYYCRQRLTYTTAWADHFKGEILDRTLGELRDIKTSIRQGKSFKVDGIIYEAVKKYP